MSWPTFFVLGSPKAGTTSLYEYLRQHPQVFMSEIKEPGFLRCHPDVVAGVGSARKRVLVRTREEYLALFEGAREDQVTGEATPHYLASNAALENIARWAPAARFLAVLRDPAARAFSAYMANVAQGRESRPLGAVLAEGGLDVPLVRSGYYARWIRRWWDRFGPDRLHILLLDDLKAEPARTLEGVFSHLGVRTDLPIDTSRQHNASGAPRHAWVARALDALRRSSLRARVERLSPGLARRGRSVAGMLTRRNLQRVELEPDTRRFLVEHFEPHTRELEQMLGRDLSAWRK